jgi:hypothetical protein
MRCRSRSAWPLCRAYSSIMWAYTQRSDKIRPRPPVNSSSSAAPATACRAFLAGALVGPARCDGDWLHIL